MRRIRVHRWGENGSVLLDNTKTVRTPAGKAIAVSSSLSRGNWLCEPGVKIFTPEAAGKYSIDVGVTGNMCYLSIVKITPDAKVEEVKDFKVAPKCK